MASPVTGISESPEELPDLRLIKNERRSPKSTPDNLTLSQLSKSKTSPLPLAPFTPLQGKRTKSKVIRYGDSPTAVAKKPPPPPPKLKLVLHNPDPCLSSHKDKPANKVCKTPVCKTPVQSSPALIRAREIQSNLGDEHPSCIKLMVRSHVTSGFWMGLPQPFCRKFLPVDTTMVVEDEKGEQYDLKYLAYKTGLSGGWKKFAVEHNLLEGDVLVFHLVESRKFKVYIIRANDSVEGSGACNLLTLEAHTEQNTPDNNAETVTPTPKAKKSKRPRSLSLNVVQKKLKKATLLSRSVSPLQLGSRPLENSGNGSSEVGSEVLEGSRPSKPELSFQEVKTFEDFHIMVHGQCVDSELPEDVRRNYYKLCDSRKEFIHDALPEGLYHKLVAGMIGQTVNIATEIKNCKPTVSKEEFEVWDNALKSFRFLGMKVGFLRDRIRVLARLVFESEEGLDLKRFVEAKTEQKRAKNEIKKHNAILVELKESSRKFEGIVENLKGKAEKLELKFQEEVDAPF